MQVILSPLASLKMTYYIDVIDYEISGLGIVEKLSSGDVLVTDIFLLEQEVTGAETTLDPAALGKFWNEKLNEPDFPVEKVKLWWHSHVDMSVFWSTTDIATIENLDTEQDEENWWLSIVGNKSGDRKARIDVYKPHRMHQDDIDLIVGADMTLKEDIRKEVEEKVTIKQIQTKKKSLVHDIVRNTGLVRGKNGLYLPVSHDERDVVVEEEEEVNIYMPLATKKLKKGKNRTL